MSLLPLEPSQPPVLLNCFRVIFNACMKAYCSEEETAEKGTASAAWHSCTASSNSQKPCTILEETAAVPPVYIPSYCLQSIATIPYSYVTTPPEKPPL